ncbi:MAG: hypothetical protein R2911_14120 [Caldilineaceae bacterium]
MKQKRVSTYAASATALTDAVATAVAASPAPTADVSDRFMQTLRQTLEHINDDDWLVKNSPLAAVFFAGGRVSTARRRQVVLTGLTGVDEQLRAIWHLWEERAKSPLQDLLWEAVCHLPPDLESHSQAILLLTYFEEPRPKQSAVIKMLALGRSTYYRYLDKAVEALGDALVQTLRPALRLERPHAPQLVGRDAELGRAIKLLEARQLVHLLGGGGLGKTSLGAHLAERWLHPANEAEKARPANRINPAPNRSGVFWYTFRRGLTDHMDHLLYALAWFLHEQGVSGLWLYLNTNPDKFSSGGALTILRQHLAELRAAPPLLCFDEVDLLLGDGLSDSVEHERLRAFLDDLSRAARGAIPILLIGQKLLCEPDADGLITLAPLTADHVSRLLQTAHIQLDPSQQEQLLAYTRGNPLLLRLFLALHQRGAALADVLAAMQTPAALDWLLLRLRQHLIPAELTILYELAVFQSGAPQDAWRSGQKHLRSLQQLGLVNAAGADAVTLHPALRDLLYRQLPPAQRMELHLAAAHLLAERGRFTTAAWHYIEGGRPELAVWTWYTHRQHEIDQGQAGAARQLFLPLAQSTLPTADDQRVLALLLAPLLARAGQAQEGLMLLEGVTWPAEAPTAALAHAARGELLAEVGDIDRSLAEFRRSLESMAQQQATRAANLHINIGRRALVYLGDRAQAQREAMQARLNLELLQGEIANAAGDFTAARGHYVAALGLAQAHGNDHRLAKIHEELGVLEARYAKMEAAVEHLQAAGRYYAAAGNQVCAVGMTNSGLAYAYLLNRQYAQAVPPAETALEFFNEINHSFWSAINEAYLAEAWFYLDDCAKAERYAQSGLRREEPVVRPYCLYILGHIRRVQRRFAEAQRFCRDALAAGAEIDDPWALAPAWLALAETERDAGQPAAADEAFARAIRNLCAAGRGAGDCVCGAVARGDAATGVRRIDFGAMHFRSASHRCGAAIEPHAPPATRARCRCRRRNQSAPHLYAASAQ